MIKIIAALSLPSLAMLVAACDLPEEQLTRSGGTTRQTWSFEFDRAEKPATSSHLSDDWLSMESNGAGDYFINRSDYVVRDPAKPADFAIFRVDPRNPDSDTASVESMVEFNCRNQMMRYLVTRSFDAKGRLLGHDERPSDWFRAETQPAGKIFYRSACLAS